MLKKVIWGCAIGLTVLIFLLVRFYRSVHEDVWMAEAEAVATVTSSKYVSEVSRVERFVGERLYMIVFGRDKAGNEAIVWVSGDEVHFEYAAEGVSAEEVRQKTLAKDPSNEILRVTPGKFENEYVWEVFYRRDEGDGVRYYYDYYRFRDGAPLDTWRLTKQKK